jgi:hypothetical protein
MSDDDSPDALSDLARRFLREIFTHGLVTLDEAGMQELLPVIRKVVTDIGRAGPGERALVCRLVSLAEGQITAILGLGPAVRNPNVMFPAAITVSGSLAMAPMGMHGNATVVTLPDEQIAGTPDLLYMAKVLLVILIWVAILAVPAIMQDSSLSTATQTTVDVYDGIAAAFAALVTPGLLVRNKRK